MIPCHRHRAQRHPVEIPMAHHLQPKTGWKHVVIKTKALPIVISSMHPIESQTLITGSQTQEEKEAIVQKLK